jgi:DNA-binding transcriptional ArsR family regulator
VVKHTLGTTKLLLRKSLLAIFLSLVIVTSLIAVIQLEKNSSLNINPTLPLASNLPSNSGFGLWTLPAFSSQSTFEDAVKVTQPALIGNSTRTEVYNFIVANPGIQFRGICTGLGIAVGTAEFHLGVLKKAGLISFVRDGKYKRFFATKKFSAREIKLISLLRHKTAREILEILASEKKVSHCKLASNLSISSQGLTWQMNRLREEGFIQETFEGIRVCYSLNETAIQALPKLLCLIK